jgi:hypothetical protein
MESQAALLQRHLSKLDKTVSYQREQHGPALFIYLRFQREEENVRITLLFPYEYTSRRKTV